MILIIPRFTWPAGYYYYEGLGDWEAALEQAELGLKGQPGNGDIFYLIGHLKRRQGKWDESGAAFIKATELDPRHGDYISNVSRNYMLMRNWAEAELFTDRGIFIAPENNTPYIQKAQFYLRSTGDIEKARGVIEAAMEKLGPGISFDLRSYIEILARDYQKALEIVEATAGPGWYSWKANIYRLMGQQEGAVTYYDSARVTYEERVRIDRDDHVAHSYLGIAYAGLGRREEAIREGKLAVEIMPLSRNAWAGTGPILRLAKIYAMLGEQDAAIDQLEVLLSVPSNISVALLKIDPQWDPLREHPRFRALLAGG